MKTKLTDAVVRAAKCGPDGKQVLMWCAETKGFGLLVSATTKAFIVQRRGVRRTLGQYPDKLSLAAARRQAPLKIAEIDTALNKPKEKPKPTIEEALATYIDDMRNKERSERSIEHLEWTVRHYLLPAWKGRKIDEIDEEDCKTLHRKLAVYNKEGKAEKRKYAANSALRAFRCLWRNTSLVHKDMGAIPPTRAVSWFAEKRKRSPVTDLKAWSARVAQIENPTRRNLQWFILLTGLRSHSARSLRWENVNFAEGTVHIPKPKGGEDRAFTMPLSRATLVLLRYQRRIARKMRDDLPWVWPTRGRDHKWTYVQEIKEPERKMGKGKDKVLRPKLQSPHRLRDTLSGLAVEANIHPYDLAVILNHVPSNESVTSGYVLQGRDHMRKCQERVTSLILERAGVRKRGWML